MAGTEKKARLQFIPVEKSLLHVTQDKRKVALERCASYKESIKDYLAVKDKIPCGLNLAKEYEKNKKRILDVLGGSEDDWQDWRWHMRNVITDSGILSKIIDLDAKERKDLANVEKKYRWGVNPFFASLMDRKDRNCPIRLQSIPTEKEILDISVEEDHETVQYNSPAPLITRLYPDRLIINVTNACSMFCRHCLRRRHIGGENQFYSKKDISLAIDYINENKEIRDVLVTGGDSFSLSDERLDWVLKQVHQIKHVEIKRLGTRMISTLPMRVTGELVDRISQYGPIYLNTQFNHPKEVTQEAKIAAEKLTRGGIVLSNQTVLLRGINTDKHVMKKLVQELLRIKVRPYYIFNCKKLEGISHFRPSIEDGLNIMEDLRDYTSGLAVPTYICTLPNGRGKTPVMPQYLVNINVDGKARFRSWQGFVVDYDDEKRGRDKKPKKE